MTKRLDNSDIVEAGNFLERELLITMPTTYQRKYAPLWSTDPNYISISGILDRHVGDIEAEIIEEVGKAGVYVDGSDDIPIVSTSITTEKFRINSFAVGIQYSLFELDAQRVSGRNVQLRKQNAAMRALRQREHESLVFGDSKYDYRGLLNDKNVPTIASSFDFNTATWKEMIDFFTEHLTAVEDTNNLTTGIGWIELTNKLHRKISTTYQNGDSGVSVAEAIMKTYGVANGGTLQGFKKINEVRPDLLEEAKVHAAGSDLERIVFLPVDVDAVDRLASIPMFLPPERKGAFYETIFILSTTETMVHYPASLRYVDVAKVN